jgi:hypothetical protein
MLEAQTKGSIAGHVSRFEKLIAQLRRGSPGYRAMGNTYDPVTAGTQSSFAQSEATRRNSNRFRPAKQRIAVSAARHEAH